MSWHVRWWVCLKIIQKEREDALQLFTAVFPRPTAAALCWAVSWVPQRNLPHGACGLPALLGEPCLRVAGVRTRDGPDSQGAWWMFGAGGTNSQYPLLKEWGDILPLPVICLKRVMQPSWAFLCSATSGDDRLSCCAPSQGHYDDNKLWKQVKSSVQIARCYQHAYEGPLLARWYPVRGSGGVSCPRLGFHQRCFS